MVVPFSIALVPFSIAVVPFSIAVVPFSIAVVAFNIVAGLLFVLYTWQELELPESVIYSMTSFEYLLMPLL